VSTPWMQYANNSDYDMRGSRLLTKEALAKAHAEKDKAKEKGDDSDSADDEKEADAKGSAAKVEAAAEAVAAPEAVAAQSAGNTEAGKTHDKEFAE